VKKGGTGEESRFFWRYKRRENGARFQHEDEERAQRLTQHFFKDR